MKNNTRKTIGFILTLVVGIAIGWLYAWNQPSIELFIGSFDGFGNIVAALLGIVALGLVIFWPKTWNTTLHRLLIVALILVVVFGGTKMFGDAFAQAPWLMVLAVIGAILAVFMLYGMTLLDNPTASLKTRFRKKR